MYPVVDSENLAWTSSVWVTPSNWGTLKMKSYLGDLQRAEKATLFLRVVEAQSTDWTMVGRRWRLSASDIVESSVRKRFGNNADTVVVLTINYAD